MGETSQPVHDADTAKLLAWLADHDAPCPLCGYNLRALTRAVCPECKQELVLTVGAKRVRLAWFLIALAPGMFSGIAALFLAVPIVGQTLLGTGYPPWGILLVDVFGLASGGTAILLARRRVWFLRMQMPRQRSIAMSVWGVHVVMFIFLLTTVFFW